MTGFISIDCGYTATPSYPDGRTGLTYVADVNFTDLGVTHTVNMGNLQPDLALRYATVRFFPGDGGTRSCYTLRSLAAGGGKYYVRATFGYGNYDALNRLPTFDLYLGVNYWTTVRIVNSSTAYVFETIAAADEDYLQVCLANKGLGNPFISGLDLRPLQPNLYPGSNATHSLVSLSFFRDTVGFGFNRYHFGMQYQHIRYVTRMQLLVRPRYDLYSLCPRNHAIPNVTPCGFGFNRYHLFKDINILFFKKN